MTGPIWLALFWGSVAAAGTLAILFWQDWRGLLAIVISFVGAILAQIAWTKRTKGD